jgi:hypothetical protein
LSGSLVENAAAAREEWDALVMRCQPMSIAELAVHLARHADEEIRWTVLSRMCGDSYSANSAASLTTPRQSANGFPDVGGGDGHDR